MLAWIFDTHKMEEVDDGEEVETNISLTPPEEITSKVSFSQVIVLRKWFLLTCKGQFNFLYDSYVKLLQRNAIFRRRGLFTLSVF